MTIAPETHMVSEDFDVQLPSGRIRVRRFGSQDAPLAICVPGLSANLAGFDFIAERVAGDDQQIVAMDLRGRGRSDVTMPGTYGWYNHAADVFGVADSLGAKTFSLIGQSSGAAISMTCARLDAARIERMVLIDLCGTIDRAAVLPVTTSVSRLGALYPSADAAIALIKAAGLVPEWNEYWERYFRYEIKEVEGGVTTSSDRSAVMEDVGYGDAMYWPEEDAPIRALWTSITMPSLLLRATQEIMPGFQYILPKAEAERFAREVPNSTLVEIDANHYTICMHADAAAAIAAFLTR
jgi:pimeloyl-ACP methyl ester carboxylesterase